MNGKHVETCELLRKKLVLLLPFGDNDVYPWVCLLEMHLWPFMCRYIFAYRL